MTWGISGPAFLGVYAVVLALLLAGAARARHRLGAGPGARMLAPASAGPAGGAEALDTDEIALLSGGPPMVGATALLGLQEGGALVLRRTTVRAGDCAPATASRVQLRLWQRLHETGWVTPNRARRMAAEDPAVDDVRQSLVTQGLVPDAAMTKAVRRWVLLFGLLGVLGVARLVTGIVRDRPVGFLVVLLILTVLAMAWTYRAPRLTAAGREHLRGLRARSAAYRSGGLPGERAIAVALFGAAVLWSADAAMAEALGMQRASVIASGDGLADLGGLLSSSDGSGSSDGGGSSCGGGCGGGGCGG